MRVEYDLINELGRSNWIDLVAGEAVVIGHSIPDPFLVAQGTRLASMVKDIRYDDDRFVLVEALAVDLQLRLQEIKNMEKSCIFIDDIFEGNEKNKPLDKWEYDLICCDRRYEVRMLLPRFDASTPVDSRKELTTNGIRNQIPDFDKYLKVVEEHDFQTQVFRVEKYIDDNKVLRCRIVDHDHEGGWYRGWIEVYYFDTFEEAIRAWGVVKLIQEID